MYQSRSSLLATASTLFLFALFLGARTTPFAVAQGNARSDQSSAMRGAQGVSPSQMSGPAAEASAEQPRIHFQQARRAFDSKDYNAAADHIMTGVEEMRREAANATPENAHNLREASDNLAALASRVRQGEVKSDAELKSHFADAYSALSQHYYQQARETWENKGPATTQSGTRESRTGHYLSAAADNFNNWAEEAGTQVKSGTRGVVDTTKDVAGHLISGTGKVTKGTGEAIDKFGDTIRGYGDRMKIKARTPESTRGAQPQPGRMRNEPAPSTQPAPGSRQGTTPGSSSRSSQY